VALKAMQISKKPLFWIIFCFVIRLVGITNPPLEGGHSWRQITGLMVARNFIEVNANPLYPRVDLEGGEDQVIGMEFPLLNYGHYLLSELFGYTHWYGRLLNLLFSSIGIFYFSRLVAKLFNDKVALYTSLAMLFSIFFSYSRKMMPDTFSVALALTALYHAHQYLKEQRSVALFYFVALSLLALLSKITAGLVLTPLALYYFDPSISRKRWLSFVIGFMLSCVPVYFWYFFWNPHLSETFGLWYNDGMSLSEGWKEISKNWQASLKNFYYHAFYAFSGFALLIWGLVKLIKDKQSTLLSIFGIYALFGIMYMLKSGFYFYHHNYYIIPFVPLFALLVGYGLSKIRDWKMAFALVFILAIESIANQQHDFFIREKVEYKMQLEGLMDKVSEKDEKIVVLGSGNPQLIYLSHRKGWLRSEEQLKDDKEVEHLRKSGAEFLILDKHTEEQIEWPGALILDHKNFAVFKF
jgi:hypothetical protein